MAIIIVELENGELIRIDEEVAKANGWKEYKKLAVEAKPEKNKAIKPKAKAEDIVEVEDKVLDADA